MSNVVMTGRRVCVVGPRLAPIAREALPGAALESVAPESLQSTLPGDRAPDLVLIDADSATPEQLVAAIEALARRPTPRRRCWWARACPRTWSAPCCGWSVPTCWSALRAARR
jgi:hypothetical protein